MELITGYRVARVIYSTNIKPILIHLSICMHGCMGFLVVYCEHVVGMKYLIIPSSNLLLSCPILSFTRLSPSYFLDTCVLSSVLAATRKN